MIILTDAAHDEHGLDGYEGSRAGDQTGDEVRNITYDKVRDFWNDPKTQVIRCLRDDVREAYTIRCQQTADNAHIGYSQPNRKTFYEQLQKDPDPSHISVDVECDCSALINGCVNITLRTIGHRDANVIYQYGRTADMSKMYSVSVLFEFVESQIDLKTGKGLKRGDILVIPNKHTAVVYDVIPDPEPPKYDKYGIATTEVYLRTAPSAFAQKCNIQLVGEGIRNYLRKGERVPIIGESGAWYQVAINGVYSWTPWVSKRYITIV